MATANDRPPRARQCAVPDCQTPPLRGADRCRVHADRDGRLPHRTVRFDAETLALLEADRRPGESTAAVIRRAVQTALAGVPADAASRLVDYSSPQAIAASLARIGEEVAAGRMDVERARELRALAEVSRLALGRGGRRAAEPEPEPEEDGEAAGGGPAEPFRFDIPLEST